MSTNKQPLLKVSDLRVKFNRHVVLDKISFEVGQDETMAVIGPNGAGKTVLFRALLGLVPYTGTVTWQEGVKIGYVPQKLYVEADLPLTTEEFFGLKNAKKADMEAAMEAVGLDEDKPHPGHRQEHILKRKLGVLSGGQLQRVLIAWALVGHPDVLLFDEPTAGIDVSAEETIYTLLHKLQEREKLAMMLISHELQVVYRYATNVLCLNKEKVCFGPPGEVLDGDSLAKLFGNEVGLYHHDHRG